MTKEEDTAPMSRRDELRSERRSAILETATQFFLENGYAGTTMSAVAARLGGSKGTLWSYFCSKEELFSACMEQCTQQFQSELILILHPGAPLRKAITGFCRRFIEKIRQPDSIALYRLLCGEAARAPEASRIFFERGPGVVEAMLTVFLAGHIAAGRLRACPPIEMADFLFSLCTGMMHQRALLGLASSDCVAADHLATQVTESFFTLYALDPAES